MRSDLASLSPAPSLATNSAPVFFGILKQDVAKGMRQRTRNFFVRSLALASVLGLAACETSNMGMSNKSEATTPAVTMTPNPQGEVVGQGKVRIAMMLPLTGPGNAAAVAKEIKNSALLAMQDFGQQHIQLVIKDTKAQTEHSQDLANEAVREGSSAVLGPLFSANVSAASAVTQPAGRTMIAFSSDASVARRGVYLLSYLPQDDVRRIILYATKMGSRSILAFLPMNAEGAVREAALRQVAASRGANVQVIKYERTGPGIQAAARNSVQQVATVDTIYIPEGGAIPGVILKTIASKGGNLTGKKVLGSGNWERLKAGSPHLNGALYPGRDVTRFNQFASRYQSVYGARPGVMGATGYDAVTLVSELVRQNGTKAFTPAVLENNRGFYGVNGIFRLRANGTSERGLAIYQIVNGRGQMVEPAPKTFTAGSG